MLLCHLLLVAKAHLVNSRALSSDFSRCTPPEVKHRNERVALSAFWISWYRNSLSKEVIALRDRFFRLPQNLNRVTQHILRIFDVFQDKVCVKLLRLLLSKVVLIQASSGLSYNILLYAYKVVCSLK